LQKFPIVINRHSVLPGTFHGSYKRCIRKLIGCI